jgi:hypothetical protein
MPRFTPRDARTDERHELKVTQEQQDRLERGHHWSKVITTTDGKRWMTWGAPCGASPGCFCDAIAIEIPEGE